MPNNILSGPFGAYTLSDAKVISQALAAQGFGTTGNIYYLDPKTGVAGANGLAPQAIPGQQGTGPVATLAAGYALMASGNTDVLVLIGDGTTNATARLSAGFTWSKNAAHFIGICSGSRVSQRARIAPTLAVAGFANFFTLSGNGCYFANLEFFQGFTTGVAAEICMTVSGQRNTFNNVSISGMGDTSASAGAADTGSRNLLLSAGENYFLNCSIGLDTVVRSVANYSVEITGNSARNMFEGCIFASDCSSANAAAILTAAAAAIDRYTMFRGCIFINAIQSGATSVTGVIKMAASAGGMMVLQDTWSVGYASMGFDATSLAQIYSATPVSTRLGGLATVTT